MVRYPTIGTAHLPTVVLSRGTVTVTEHLDVEMLYNVIDNDDMHDISVETPEVVYWDSVDVVYGNLHVDVLYVIGSSHLRILGTSNIKNKSLLGLPEGTLVPSTCRQARERLWWITYNALLYFKPVNVRLT